MSVLYRYDPEQLAGVLWRVEDELRKHSKSRHARILLIGGVAIALGYRGRYGTTDIDTIEAEDAFIAAWQAVVSKSKEPMPALHRVTVADAPYNFEDRIHRIEVLRPGTSEKMAKLQIDVPEQHDLAMMKIVRGEARDEQGIRALHEAEPLEPERLVDLYRTEMSHIIGSMKEFRWKFLNIYGVLYGITKAKKLEKTLPILK